VKADLLIHSAAELVTATGPGPCCGPAQSELRVIRDGAVAVVGENIAAVGTSAQLWSLVGANTKLVDAKGQVVMPGFVDAHTHLVFAGSRETEFERRIRGDSYLQLMAAGGGIMSTVRATRAASLDDLVMQSKRRADVMVAHGTTTAEVKTGYGLDTAVELRMLQAVARLGSCTPLELVPTFLGAHAVPTEHASARDTYVSLVVDEMLPVVIAPATGVAAPRFCDVFCEEGAFSVAESRRVLEAARRLGLGLKVHADEFGPSGGAELAADVGALSADHLAYCTPGGMSRLAKAGVMAVLLPGTTFGLGQQHYADGRALISAGVAVALGTDLNPGTCWCESMPFIVALACRYNGLTPAEAIVAATLNAAHAVGLGERLGSLEPGRQADLVVLNLPTHQHLAYRFGTNPVCSVIKRGIVVVGS